MRKLLVFIVSIAVSSAVLQGQAASERVPKAKPVAPKPAAPDASEKPGLMKRIFGKSTPAPTPAPAATPKPTPRPRPKQRKPAPEIDEANPGSKPAEPASAKPAESAKSKPPKTDKPAAPELSDAEKYKAVRAKAMEDEKIKALATKAGSVISADEAEAATTEYNRALFRKIREMEPSLDAYVDRVEAAMSKRLATEKKAN